MTKETSEEHRKGILASVSKFLNRDNIYASKIVTYPHAPSIEMDSIGDTNSNNIVHLYFDEEPDFINGVFERKLCLVADYWVETKSLWHSAWLPMEQFPEAYKMFLNKYEQLDGEKKATKEEIEEYRKELEMWEDKKYEETQQTQTEQPHRETLEETRKWIEEQEKQYKDNAQPQDTTDYTIKYDQNKPKLSQFPREAMEAVAEVMEYGARKYGSGTWSRVEAQRYVDAAARHLYAMQDIDENGRECINLSKIDEESGLEHLYHLACNVVYAVAIYRRTKRNETR